MATTVSSRPGAVFDPQAFDTFAATFRGDIVQPGDPGYDTARAIYNGMIDKRPALIARCVDVADVIATVGFARETGVDLAIRGGGHNGPGLGTVEGGIVLDLGPMQSIRVDPVARTARVEGGATWNAVDHATHAFGLAVPSGTVSSTGVGGLTLGGGIGNLARRYGLTIDNLLAADVILADGSMVTASADEHPDLFWALRGGGGNFGVVTSFLFRLHPVDTIIGGPTFWSMDDAEKVLRWYGSFIQDAPEELNGFFAFLNVPPGPPFPEELHRRNVAGILWCYSGPKEKADEVFAPVMDIAPPLLHAVHEMPYPALQSLFDPLVPPGLQWYWKADFLAEITDASIPIQVEHGGKLPTQLCTTHIYPINGAARRVANHETAFSYRDASFAQVMVGIDPDPANAGKITQWARDYWDAIHPHSAGGAYVNMMMEEGDDRIRAAYRENYDRLRAIKAVYDPTNLFHINQNIAPAT
jgi:FAD/FMN-containing dehydrogenase